MILKNHVHHTRDHRCRLSGPEALETRTLLSTGLIASHPHSSNRDHEGPAERGSWTAPEREAKKPATSLDIAIRGTDIKFDAFGLPSFVAGDLYLVSAGVTSQDAIGRYEENLTPILMDVNGDGMPDLVGAAGIATFSFFVGDSHHVNVGSFTAADCSLITGLDSMTGQIQTADVGTIVSSPGVYHPCESLGIPDAVAVATTVSSSGVFKHLTGGFTGFSAITLFPSFSMQTSLHFEVNKAAPNDHRGDSVGDAASSTDHFLERDHWKLADGRLDKEIDRLVSELDD